MALFRTNMYNVYNYIWTLFSLHIDCKSDQFEDQDESVKILIKDEVEVSDNQTVIEETQYFDDSQFYTGLVFAIGAAVFGAIANILVSKCSSYSSLLLTFWRYI